MNRTQNSLPLDGQIFENRLERDLILTCEFFKSEPVGTVNSLVDHHRSDSPILEEQRPIIRAQAWLATTNLAHLNRFPGIDARIWDQIQ